MGTIYGLAKEVIIWLDPRKKVSEAAMNFISETTATASTCQPDFSSDSHRSKLRETLKLMNREYWRQLWIIQEIFRARKIILHCGRESLPWTDLAKFFRHIRRRYSDNLEKQSMPLKKIWESHAAKVSCHGTSLDYNLEELLTTYRLVGDRSER